MAKRRPIETRDVAAGPLILPRHLADNQECRSAEEFREFTRDRNVWLDARGINPCNWNEVHPILLASWAAYGIARGSLQRARLQLADLTNESRIR
jgi:hypothetical protein